MEINPWRTRFAALDRDEIAKRMTITPPPYSPSSSKKTELVARELGQRMENLFLPTSQLLNIAEVIIGVAYAHSYIHYPSVKTYVANCYMKDVPLSEYVPAIGITGLAGIGKTAFAKAIQRCMLEEVQISLPDHEPMTLEISWMLTMPERLTPAAVLKAFLDQDGAHSAVDKTIPLVARCRRQAYKKGVSLASLDETQFTSFSRSANSAITSVLINICRLGIPSVFYQNFSLGHSLWRRPQQDRQRLLSRHFTILPDAADSEDWRSYLKAVQSLAPDIIHVDVDRDAEEIHYWSAGIKRLVMHLILLAVEANWRNGKPVNAIALKAAFESTQFKANRDDVDLIYKQLQTNKQADRSRPDLWCPYPVEETEFSKLAKTVLKMKEKERMEKLVEYSTTPAEKGVLDDIRKGASAVGAKGKSKITPIAPARDLAALQAADDEFRKDQ